MNILLVRHGETAWNREGRYQGRTDIPLSETGQLQVRTLGERLKDVPIDDRLRVAAVAREKHRRSDPRRPHDDAPARPGPPRNLARPVGGQARERGRAIARRDVRRLEVAARPDAPRARTPETLGDVETRAWAVLEMICERLGPRRHRTRRRARRGQPRDPVPRARPAARADLVISARRRRRSTCCQDRGSPSSRSCA